MGRLVIGGPWEGMNIAIAHRVKKHIGLFIIIIIFLTTVYIAANVLKISVQKIYRKNSFDGKRIPDKRTRAHIIIYCSPGGRNV